MRKKKKTKVFVAMSGGVDSSVVALLLKKKGYDLVGCFIKGWYPQGFGCDWKRDRRDAMRVCAKLDIPFITVDAEKEYKRKVVDYMIREYKAGRTPNPDVMCNRSVKFGVFLKKVLEMGADYIATGHYVRLRHSRHLGARHLSALRCLAPKLLQARDKNKDQSYFLWALTQEQLRYCMFPIGNLLKPEVKKIAREAGLHTAGKDESMGVCFIGEFNMVDFLKKYIKPKKGKVVTADGKVIGEHEGAVFYTIGQRHGFGGGGGIPYYIVGKDIKKNLLIVADKVHENEFYKKEVEIESVNWVSGKPPHLDTECPSALGHSVSKLLKARIRYRQPLQSCRINYSKNTGQNGANKMLSLSNSTILVKFSKPQRAVTPGQSLVIYDGQTMLGGGIII